MTWETPESLALASATREALQAALELLPLRYREVILLCDVEEMKYKKIAEVLAIPIGTVMSRIAREQEVAAATACDRAGGSITCRWKTHE